jgi:hypothetical protein
MKSGIAALILMGVALLGIGPTNRWIADSGVSNSWVPNSWVTISWVTPLWAEDVPPSAAAPQTRSDQPDAPAPTVSSRTEAQFTTQPTGSATDAQLVVPMAQRVDPVVSNQPAGGEASK